MRTTGPSGVRDVEENEEHSEMKLKVFALFTQTEVDVAVFATFVIDPCHMIFYATLIKIECK